MDRQDYTPRNRSERIRGDLERYWRLANLGLEAHTVRDVGETVWHDEGEFDGR